MTWSRRRGAAAVAGGEARGGGGGLHGGAALPAMFQEKGGEHGIECDDVNPTVVKMKAGTQRWRRIWSEKEGDHKGEKSLVLGARWMKLKIYGWKR